MSLDVELLPENSLEVNTKEENFFFFGNPESRLNSNNDLMKKSLKTERDWCSIENIYADVIDIITKVSINRSTVNHREQTKKVFRWKEKLTSMVKQVWRESNTTTLWHDISKQFRVVQITIAYWMSSR